MALRRLSGRGPRSASRPERPGRKVAIFVAATAATALIGAGVTYAVQGALTHLGRPDLPVALHVEIDPVNSVSGLAGAYVVPRTIDELRGMRPPNGECGSAMHELAAGLGGSDAGATNLRVTVQGRSEASVVLTLRVKILERHAVKQGIYLTCPRGGDAVVPRDVRFDLDEKSPSPHYFISDQEAESALIMSVTKGHEEIIDIHAAAEDGLYHWVAELDILADGQRIVETLDDSGKPFRTSGVVRAAAYSFQESEWVQDGF